MGKGQQKERAMPARRRLQADREDPRGLALSPYKRVNVVRSEVRKDPVLETYRLNRKEKRPMREASASTGTWIPRVRVSLSAVVSAS